MKYLFVYLASAAFMLCSYPANAAGSACSYAGVYSNLTVDKTTGDMSGYEIIITISPYGHEAIFTQAQGNFPIKPIVADAIVKDGKISFEVTIDSRRVSVRAEPTCSYLKADIRWDNGATDTINIPRAKSFWDNSKKASSSK